MEKEMLENFRDERGILVFASPKILNFKYKYLTMGTMTPGTERGGHYHKETKEMLLCLSGQITLQLENINQKEGHVIVMFPGEIIDIPLNTVHTLRNNGKTDVVFIEFKDREFNAKKADTYEK